MYGLILDCFFTKKLRARLGSTHLENTGSPGRNSMNLDSKDKNIFINTIE